MEDPRIIEILEEVVDIQRTILRALVAEEDEPRNNAMIQAGQLLQNLHKKLLNYKK